MNDLYLLGLALTLVLLAMTSGILTLYAHTIMPGLKKVADPTFVRAFQAIDGAIINPFFMLQFFLPIFLLCGLLWYTFGTETQDVILLGSALFLYIITVGLTIAINVPLNDAIKKVDPKVNDLALTQARHTFNEQRWAMANIGRAITTLGSTILVVVIILS